MTTEEEIIYAIWDVVRAGKANQDDPINERLMRSFLRIHRGKHLNALYLKGIEVSDEVFQYLGEITFTYDTNEFVSTPIPKIIRFDKNYGVMADIQGYTVSIVGQEEWRNARFDKYNKHHPLIKMVNNRMVLSKGMLQANQLDDFASTELNTVVKILNPDPIPEPFTVNIPISAVLVNPDDEPGYDFTTSPYPYPDELIEDLINSVNAREFGIFLRMKSDTVGNLQDEANPTRPEKEI